MIYLSAGTHTLEFVVAVNESGDTAKNWVGITNITLKILGFSDVTSLLYDSGSVSVPASSTVTVVNQTINVINRKLAVGNLKQTSLRIVAVLLSDNRVNVLKNPNEADTSNLLNWKLLINDTQISWAGRVNDYTGYGTANYGVGAHGEYSAIVNAGDAINIKINAANTSASALNARAVIFVFACPWIIPSVEYEPLILNFPQGSTLYLVLEPLWQDPTKTVKLGKVRAWSFGDTTNYYSTTSGTGIVSWNYTFESVEVSSCLLLVSGYGGCISIIAVDVR
jgi:hypothetical protein